MGKLSDILGNGDSDQLRRAWENSSPADDLSPLPAGTYVAHILSGELFSNRNDTPGYKLTFKVIAGVFSGRYLWLDIWLTPAALPMAKRDLGKIGVKDLEQLENPLPPGIRCNVRIALRRDDDGVERNRVCHFEVAGIDKPQPDPFAPNDEDIDTGDGPEDATL